MTLTIQERLRHFATELLSRRGALVDWPPEAAEGLAILPEKVAARLGCMENPVLSYDHQEGGLTVSLGSHFLDQVAPLLETESLAGIFKAPDLYLKQSGMAEPVARTFSWLNAKVVVHSTSPASLEYHTWTFLASLRSDDSWDDLVTVTINSETGARVDFPDPLNLREIEAQGIAADIPESLYRQAARQALLALEQPAAPFIERMESRLGRDRRRLREYYGALIGDPAQKSPHLRRELSPEEIEARKRAVDLELRRKLAELQERYAVSVKLTPITLIRTELVALAVYCEVYRKKSTRTHRIFWNPLTKQLEPMSCGRCGVSIYAVAFADETIIPLCSSCVSNKNGAAAGSTKTA